MLRDLGSTNGTKLHGEKIREAGLPTGSTFTIGRTELHFSVVPVTTQGNSSRGGLS